jgi:methionyl-tRNA formyltransferase
MTSLKAVGFASGSPQSIAAMVSLARDHRLAAIVVPGRSSRLRQLARRALGRPNPLERLGAPLIDSSQIERFRPDIIVVASYPRLIPAAALGVARIGALNMHMSLLPRHRGVDPIFWTYWDDDPQAGVTIHWMTERFDAGDIAAQEALLFPRGLASRMLYVQLTSLGVDLLARVLTQVASGLLPRKPQNETGATYESAADIARARLPLAQWPAERVWHVLSGLGDQRSGLFAGAAGLLLAHGRATGYRLTDEIEPGRVVVARGGYELHCRDGIVAVESSA